MINVVSIESCEKWIIPQVVAECVDSDTARLPMAPRQRCGSGSRDGDPRARFSTLIARGALSVAFFSCFHTIRTDARTARCPRRPAIAGSPQDRCTMVAPYLCGYRAVPTVHFGRDCGMPMHPSKKAVRTVRTDAAAELGIQRVLPFIRCSERPDRR